jgi:hypothetical protein
MAITISTIGRTTARISTEDIANAKTILEDIKNGFERAYARALNTTLTGVRTDLVAMARDDYAFRADAVRSRITLNNATFSDLNASIVSRGDGVLLSDFVGTRQISTGLSVNVKRSTGRQYITHGFLNQTRSGKIVAMRRQVIDGQRVRRYPVQSLYGPHPEIVWNVEENWAKLEVLAGERLDANFEHEVDYVLERYSNT